MNVSYRLVLILGQTFLEVSKALCGSLKPCKKTTFDIFTHPIIYIYGMQWMSKRIYFQRQHKKNPKSVVWTLNEVDRDNWDSKDIKGI